MRHVFCVIYYTIVTEVFENEMNMHVICIFVFFFIPLIHCPIPIEELQRVLNLKHSTTGKAVFYTLVDKGECFIIYATIELDIQYSDYIFDLSNKRITQRN